MLRPKLSTAKKLKEVFEPQRDTSHQKRLPPSSQKIPKLAFLSNTSTTQFSSKIETSRSTSSEQLRSPRLGAMTSPPQKRLVALTPASERIHRQKVNLSRRINTDKKNAIQINENASMEKGSQRTFVKPFSLAIETERPKATSERPGRPESFDKVKDTTFKAVLNVVSKMKSFSPQKINRPKPTLKLKFVTQERQTEMTKYLKRIHPVTKLIKNSIAVLKEDFQVIMKSDFSILGKRCPSDSLAVIEKIADLYFAMELELLQSILESVDPTWFDLSYQETKKETVSLRKRRNAQTNLPEFNLEMLSEKINQETKNRKDLELAEIGEDQFYLTNTLFSTFRTEETEKFDGIYTTLYGSEFDQDVETSVKNMNRRMKASELYKPPIGKCLVDCKQSKKVRSKIYSSYHHRIEEKSVCTLWECTNDYISFSLNFATISMILLQSGKYLLGIGKPDYCFCLLEKAINVALLFRSSEILIHIYKTLGEYYLSFRNFEMAQMAFTKALNHSIKVGDLKFMLLMYDAIGSLP